jgi:hypothetical protein
VPPNKPLQLARSPLGHRSIIGRPARRRARSLSAGRWADYLRLSQYPGSRAAWATAATSMLSGNSRKKMT